MCFVAPLSRATRSLLWSLTHGHMGILTALLSSLQAQFKDPNTWKVGAATRNATKIEMQRWLSSPENLHSSVGSLRSFSCIRLLSASFPQLQFLADAIKFSCNDQALLPISLVQSDPLATEALFRNGFIDPLNGAVDLYCFIAPLLHTLLVRLLGRRAAALHALSLPQLIARCVHTMRQSVLNSLPPDQHNKSTFSKVE